MMPAGEIRSRSPPAMTEEERRKRTNFEHYSQHERTVYENLNREFQARKALADRENTMARGGSRYNGYSHRDNRYGPRFSSPSSEKDKYKSPRERGVITDAAENGPTIAMPLSSNRTTREPSRSERSDEHRERGHWENRDSDRERRRDHERSPAAESRAGRLTPVLSPKLRESNLPGTSSNNMSKFHKSSLTFLRFAYSDTEYSL